MLKFFQTSGKLPKLFKLSKRELGNYRPISVLPLVSKVFEKIIYYQLYDYLQENRLLNTYQSSFRSMHSTTTALLEATNNWSININNGLLNGVLFIDLKNALDTVDHEIILRKLANYGVDPNALRFFASYLSNRSQKCTVNGVLSSVSKLTCGVLQSSILGPLLFLIYINDLPNCLDISCAKMFPDDTNITVPGCTFAELEQATNSELTDLCSWLEANKLTSLNIAKTEFMGVSSRQKFLAENCSELNIRLDNQLITPFAVHLRKICNHLRQQLKL